jgi:hypothetical protein
MIVDVVFTEVFDKGKVGVRSLTLQLDDVGHTLMKYCSSVTSVMVLIISL